MMVIVKWIKNVKEVPEDVLNAHAKLWRSEEVKSLKRWCSLLGPLMWSGVYCRGPQKNLVGLWSSVMVKNCSPAVLNSSRERSPSLLVSIAPNDWGAIWGSKPRIRKKSPYSPASIIWSLLLNKIKFDNVLVCWKSLWEIGKSRRKERKNYAIN